MNRCYAEALRGAGLTVGGACVLSLLFGQPRVEPATAVWGFGLGLVIIAIGAILMDVAARRDLAAEEEENDR